MYNFFFDYNANDKSDILTIYGFFKKMFIRLFNFSRSLATKCMSLMNSIKLELFLIDLNPVELKYYPSMITLDKRNGNCNTFSAISDRKRYKT